MKTIKSTIKDFFYISPRNKRFIKRKIAHIINYYVNDILEIIVGILTLGGLMIASYVLLLLIFDQ